MSKKDAVDPSKPQPPRMQRPTEQPSGPPIPMGPDGKPLTVDQQLGILKAQYRDAHGNTAEVFGNIFNQLVQAIAAQQNMLNEKDKQLQERDMKIAELTFNNNQLMSGKIPPKPKVSIHSKK